MCRMALADYHVAEWLPFPGRGERCPISSLSRSALRLLCVPCRENGLKPPVRSKVVKFPGGGGRGRRMIDVESLREWMRKQMDEG